MDIFNISTFLACIIKVTIVDFNVDFEKKNIFAKKRTLVKVIFSTVSFEYSLLNYYIVI